jgi:predicted ATP-dependent serine protease
VHVLRRFCSREEKLAERLTADKILNMRKNNPTARGKNMSEKTNKDENNEAERTSYASKLASLSPREEREVEVDEPRVVKAKKPEKMEDEDSDVSDYVAEKPKRLSQSDLPNVLNESYIEKKRIAPGIPYLDDCFVSAESGKKGFEVGSVTIVTGEKGLGKSTLALQLLDGFTAAGCLTIMATNEQSKVDILGMLKRLSLKNGINIVLDSPTKAQEICMYAQMHRETLRTTSGHKRQLVLVVDSLGNLEDGDRNHSKHAFEELRAFATRTKAIVLIVNHLTKVGAVSGSGKVTANSDTIIEVGLDGRLKGNDGVSAMRQIKIGKNRQGLGHAQLAASMDPRAGLNFLGNVGQEATGIVEDKDGDDEDSDGSDDE